MNKEFKKVVNSKRIIFGFNFDNLEMFKAVIEASYELDYPLLAMATQSSINNLGFDYVIGFFNSYLKSLSDSSKQKVFLHLDHSFDLDLIERAIKNNFNSVMFDGSRLSDIENIEKTKKIVNLAKKYDVLVEGEIGIIGGKEDDIINENSNFTSLKQAINFYQKTQVDFLAISVGSIHGEYKNKPNLQFDLIREIKNNVNTSLVLHGSSGIELDDLKKSINAGIKKINIGTDLKIAYVSGIKKAIEMNIKDPKKISKIIISNIKDEIVRKVKYLIN